MDVSPVNAAALDSVTVSARKREESAMDTPVAVTAVSADTMQKFSIGKLEDIAQSTPQLMIQRGNSGSGASIILRGIGSTYTSIGIEQSVAVNLDGVYYGQGRVINEGLFDVAQVEILKGPQALFFGKNSPAGVISIKTNDPGDTFEALGRVGYEVEGGRLLGEAVVSGPVNDKVGLRMAVRASKMFDGLVKNEYGVPGTYFTVDSATGDVNAHPYGVSSKKGWPGDRNLFGRLTAKFTPNDDLTITLKGMVSSYISGGTSQAFEPYNCPSGSPQLSPGEPCKGDWKAGWNPVPTDIAATNPILAKRDGNLYDDYFSYGMTGTMEYDADPIAVSTVINYQHLRNAWVGDFDFTGTGAIWASEHNTYHAFSGETRALSDFEGPLDFMIGVYYQNTELQFDQDVLFIGAENSAAADPRDRYNIYRKRSFTDGATYSVFGQLIWEIASGWELAGGARYLHETKNSFFVQPYSNPTFTFLWPNSREYSADQTFNDVSPEATLTWKPTDDLTIYVAYKQGFKSGGFSNSGVDSANTVLEDFTFDPEEAEGFEGGIKASLLDDSLRLQLDIYSYKFSNLQVDFFDSTVAAFITTNAGSSRSSGVELQGDWAPEGVEGLILHGTLGYNDAHYVSFPSAPCYAGQTPAQGCTDRGAFQDISGTPTFDAPKWVGSLGFDYDRPVGNGLTMGVSLNGRYSSRYNTSPFNDPAGMQKAYVSLDANLRFGADDESWQVALIGRNLTNEYRALYAGDAPFSGGNTGTPAGFAADKVGNFIMPRTLEIQFTVRY